MKTITLKQFSKKKFWNVYQKFWFIQLLMLSIILLSVGCKKSAREKDSINQFKKNKVLNIETELMLAKNAAGNKQVRFPEDDPGAPFYLRASNILNQFFIADGWLAIPFYRAPSCVRQDFNLLNIFDVPAAFACPLTVNGFYMVEKDAPQGTFPIIVQSTGSSVPFWFVRWTDFQVIAADGTVTIDELKSINPLMGTATKFKETLRPRMENHLVQINASGVLTDGETFDFHVTHVGDETKNINLTFK